MSDETAVQCDGGDGDESPSASTERSGECRECGRELGAGYLCDDCDTVEGWE